MNIFLFKKHDYKYHGKYLTSNNIDLRVAV